jgi:hypothetical protein
MGPCTSSRLTYLHEPRNWRRRRQDIWLGVLPPGTTRIVHSRGAYLGKFGYTPVTPLHPPHYRGGDPIGGAIYLSDSVKAEGAYMPLVLRVVLSTVS